jgi:cytochrome b6-f complex iron-sulfur subunit
MEGIRPSRCHHGSSRWAITSRPLSIRAGSPEEYALGVVSEQFKKDQRVWIGRREDGRFFAISAICTHLGCTPNWFASEDKFKCPCHGSGFHRDGTNFDGPAPPESYLSI